MTTVHFSASWIPRSPARLSDRAFLQLIVDLGQFDMPIFPETVLSAPQVSSLLALYHADSGPPFRATLSKAA